MLEVVVRLKDDWIDVEGVPDVELFKALSDWSSGKNATFQLNSFSFNTQDIVRITLSR
jgi:hypothetical protein